MASADVLIETIGTIYGAGLDEKLWPRALAGVTQVVGGIAATLEVFDRKPVALTEFHSFGLPPISKMASPRQNPRMVAPVAAEARA
jgi:hypothetical protein